jgi:hypothetical protein
MIGLSSGKVPASSCSSPIEVVTKRNNHLGSTSISTTPPKNPHYHTTTRDKMSETTTPKPSSSVKLVLLGEAAVGKVRLPFRRLPLLSPPSANTSP